MAITITRQTLVDGERNLVLKIHLAADATDTTTPILLIDMSSYSASVDGRAVANLKVMRVQSSISGFSVELLWHATTNVPFLNLYDGDMDQDFRRFGGIVNDAGTGVSGDIYYSATGNGADEEAHILLEMVKGY